jgi:hypothetical protein
MRHLRLGFVALSLLLVTAIAIPVLAQQKMPDSTLYTQYFTLQPPTQIHWVTCGSTQQSEGCYGSGTLGPFANACSIVQSVPVPISSNTVIRYIYVLDSGSTAGGAVLTAYKRVDVISPTYDTTTITTAATVPLTALVGGTGVSCMLAQNPTNVYASTSQSTSAAAINKTSYSATSLSGFDGVVSSISADSYGFVTINQVAGQGVHGFLLRAGRRRRRLLHDQPHQRHDSGELSVAYAVAWSGREIVAQVRKATGYERTIAGIVLS